MEKYLGIVKVVDGTMMGHSTRFFAKFSDSKFYLEKWFKLYPKSEKIILENNPEFQSFFSGLDDFSLVSEIELITALKTYQRTRETVNDEIERS